MANGKYQDAADLVVRLADQEGYGGKRWTDPFIPAFDLQIGMTPHGAVRDYQRSVDFQTGVAAVQWADDRGAFCRRLFVSRADDVIAVSITGPGKGGVTCQLALAARPAKNQGGWGPEAAFKDGIKEVITAASPDFLSYRSSFARNWPGGLQGYEGGARVVTTGGTVKAEKNHITITAADEVTLLIRVELLTDYSRSKLPIIKESLGKINPDFTKLLAPHVALHGNLFNRVRLDLGGGAQHNLSSEKLIASSGVGRLSPALLEHVFDAARYNIISSSGDVFPNLQGIWNGTWGPPWSGDYTLNGNVPCALAADLTGNLPECLLPFFDYLESHLPEFRENAKRLYGCRGIHVPSRTSTHGYNNHFDETWPMTFWTAGAAWMSRFYYDYALYTGDREFLAKCAVPFMKESALFYEDFLIAGPDGKLLFSPSYSPENNPSNNPSQACVNATMDIAATRELLTNLISACRSLHTDADGITRWRAMLDKLPAYQINADGAVKEWTTPLLQDNYAHRHVSHLYGLFAGLPADVAADAKLRQAFRVALEKRMEVRRRENGGIMAFGLVQMGLAADSLRDAGIAYEVVDWLTNCFWDVNFVSTHNPKSLFNTDICGGLPAVVLRMLVDSEPGRIALLPALPKQWPGGSIQGALCRGAVEVHKLQWSPGEITAVLRSKTSQDVDVSLPGESSPHKVHLACRGGCNDHWA